MIFLSKSVSLKLRLAQISVIIVFLALGVAFSLKVPFTYGPDEVAHFQFTRFIAKYGRLPVTWEERNEAGYKSDWPPLFHLLVGMTGRGIDLDSPPFVKVVQNNPRLQLVVDYKNIISWRALTTEDPYRSEVLLWYLGRWVTLLCGAAGIGAIYLLMSVSYPNHPWLALSAVTMLAFISTYVHTSGVISYEPLLGALLAFYFLLLFYTIQQPAQNWPYLVLSLLMGLAGLTKYTPLPAMPILPLLVIWLAYQNQWAWRTTAWRLILVSLGFTLTFGSWALYVIIYFNRIAELGWINGLLSTFLVSDVSDRTSLRIANLITGGTLGAADSFEYNDTLFQWIWHSFSAVWGGGWFAFIFLGLWVIALAGLVRQWRRRDMQIRLWIVLLSVHLSLFLLLPFLRFYLSRQAATGMGQHILFPAGAAIISLLVLGLNAWLNPARLTKVLIVIACLGLWQTATSIAQSSAFFWPIQTVPISNNEKILATFGEVSLINYEHVANDQTLETVLHWRAEAFLNEDYQIEITLLDAKDKPQARWLGQPLNGRYPTRAWAPGDRVRDLIQIPLAGLSPGDYQVQLRLLGQAGPLSPTKKQSYPSLPVTIKGDSLGLDRVTLTSPPVSTADTVLLNGQKIGYTLWQQSQKNMPLYGERSTIVFWVQKRLGDEIRLSLIGPDNQPREPVDHTGYIYNFNVEPHFASGEYRLRFEQRSKADIVAQVETAALLHIQTQKRQFEVGPISHPLEANFAGQVTLLGYDLPQRRVQAGDRLPVILYWQALKTIGADLIMFNHLIDKDQKIWGGNDRRAHAVYSTLLWAPGEIVTDPFTVQVEANAPDGIYNLLVGLYLPVGQAPVSLPLMQDGQLTDITSVSIGPIKVGDVSSSWILQAANPQILLNQPFGDTPNLTLLGYDLTEPNKQPIQNLPSNEVKAPKPEIQNLKLVLYWRSETPLPIDYTTFVHLRNAAGKIVAQKDQPPLNGAYPTSLWNPGEIIADEIVIPLPDELPVVEYQLIIGLYNLQTGQRLPVPNNPANEVILLGP